MLLRGTFKMFNTSVTYFDFSIKSLTVTVGGQWNEEENKCLKESKTLENFQAREENKLEKSKANCTKGRSGEITRQHEGANTAFYSSCIIGFSRDGSREPKHNPL